MMEQLQAPPCELSYMRTEHGKSSDDYRCSRILPHITEQYQFRINNRLLIEKIINPRRDKTIIDSLAKTTCSQFYKKNTRTSKLEKNMKYRRKIMPQNIQRKQINRDDLKEFNVNEQNKILRIRRDFRNVKKFQEIQVNNQIQQEQLKREKSNHLDLRYLETRQSSLRDNFVGRIIKNTPKQFDEINLSNSQQVYFTNQFPKAGRIKKINEVGKVKQKEKTSRLFKLKYQIQAYNRQNQPQNKGQLED